MRQSSRVWRWGVTIILGIVLTAAAVKWLVTPLMPADWRTLQAGMSREQVLRILTGDHYDMLENKGFDVFSPQMTSEETSGHWMLQITPADFDPGLSSPQTLKITPCEVNLRQLPKPSKVKNE